MFSALKSPFAGILLAAIAAVVPTGIVASLSAESTPESTPPVASPPDHPPSDSPANTPQDFTEPTTQPSRTDVGEVPRDNGGENGGGEKRAGGGGPFGGGGLFGSQGRNRYGFGARLEDLQAETQGAIAFFNENSPNRMAYFSKLPENSPARHYATVKLVQLYRPIQNFKETNPVLYQLLVKQVKLRDDAFELAKDNKDSDLRQKAAEIVDVTIQARHMRLEILQKELAEQQENLEKYEANRDADAEGEAAAIKNDEQRMVEHVDALQNHDHGPASMLNFDPATDPLADAAPIAPSP